MSAAVMRDAFAVPPGFSVVRRGHWWGVLGVVSAGCLGCLSLPGDRSGTDDLVGVAWCVAANVILMFLSWCLAVGMAYGPSRTWLTVVGRGFLLPVTRETLFAVLAGTLQMSTAAVVFDPESSLGVTDGGSTWNASLYAFSWTGSCIVAYLASDLATSEDKSGLLPLDGSVPSNRTGRLFGLTFVAGASLLSFSLGVQMDCASGDPGADECKLTNIGSVCGIVGMFVPTLYAGLNVLAGMDKRRQKKDPDAELVDSRTVKPSSTLLAAATFATACVNAGFLTNAVDDYGGIHANLWAASWTYVSVSLALLLGQVDRHLLPDYPSYYDESYEAELARWEDAGQRRRKKRRSRSRSNDSTAPMSEMSRSVYSEADRDLESYDMSRAGAIDEHLADFMGGGRPAPAGGGDGASRPSLDIASDMESHVFMTADGIGNASVVSSMDDTTSFVFSARSGVLPRLEPAYGRPPAARRPTPESPPGGSGIGREPSGLLGLPAPPSGRPPPDDPQGHAWTQMPTGPDDSYYAPRKPRREKSVYTLGNSTITGKVQTVDSSPSDDGSAERINSMPIGQMRDAAPRRPRMVPPADRDDGPMETFMEPVDYSEREAPVVIPAFPTGGMAAPSAQDSTGSRRSRNRSRSGSSEKSRRSSRSLRSSSERNNRASSGDEGKYSSGLDPEEFSIDIKSLARDAESAPSNARAEDMMQAALRDAEMEMLRDRQRARGGRSSRSPSARRRPRPGRGQRGESRSRASGSGLEASGRSGRSGRRSSVDPPPSASGSAYTSRSGRRPAGTRRSRAGARRSRTSSSAASGNGNAPIILGPPGADAPIVLGPPGAPAIPPPPGPLEASGRSGARSNKMRTPVEGTSEPFFPDIHVFVNDYSDSSMSEITTPGVVRGKAPSFASQSGTVPDEDIGRPNEAVSSALDFVRRMKEEGGGRGGRQQRDGSPPAAPRGGRGDGGRARSGLAASMLQPPLHVGDDSNNNNNARMSQSDHAYPGERKEAGGPVLPASQSVFAPEPQERRESLFRMKSSVNMKKDQQFIMNELKCVIEDMEDYLSTGSTPSLPATALREHSSSGGTHWSMGSSSQFRNSAGQFSSRSSSNSRLGGFAMDLPLPTARRDGQAFARMSDRTPMTAPARGDTDSSDGSDLPFARSTPYDVGRLGPGMLGPGVEGAGSKPFGRRDPAPSSRGRRSPLEPPPSPAPARRSPAPLNTPLTAPNPVRDDLSVCDDSLSDRPESTPAAIGALRPDQLAGVEAAGSMPFRRRPAVTAYKPTDDSEGDDSNPYVRRTSGGGVSSLLGPASRSDAGSSAVLNTSRLDLPSKARKVYVPRSTRSSAARARGSDEDSGDMSRSHCSGTGSGSGSRQSISVGAGTTSSGTSASSAITSKMSGSRRDNNNDGNTNEGSKGSRKSEFQAMQMCMVCDGGGSEGSSSSSSSSLSGTTTRSGDSSSSAIRSNFTPETSSADMSDASPQTQDGSDDDPRSSFQASRSGMRYGSGSDSDATRTESGSSVFAC